MKSKKAFEQLHFAGSEIAAKEIYFPKYRERDTAARTSYLEGLRKIKPDEVQQAFLQSEIPTQIEIGNPGFLCGKSGYELAIIAFDCNEAEAAIKESRKYPFYPQEEYWSGTVLAYYQWKAALSFEEILSKFPLERILANYHLMHEADISKMVAVMDEVIRA